MKAIQLCVTLIVTQTALFLCHAQNSSAPAPAPSAPEAASQASAPPDANPQAKHSSGVAEEYVIGPNDVLVVTVWKEPTLTGQLLVRPDGMISMALLGDVQASGSTAKQLSEQIESKLKKYIQSPNVTVEVSQIHSKVVYVIGEVSKKGPIEMTPGMTLLQAIAVGGGFTDYANTKKIYVLRNDAGKQVKIPVHYKEALKGDSSQNLPLQSGDTIVVP